MINVTFSVNTDKGTFIKTMAMDVVPREGDKVFIANQRLLVDNVLFVPDRLVSSVTVYLWCEGGRSIAKVFKADGWVR